jgi:N-acetylglutamate synthase-like GNAT family acetyltransferase
MNGTTQLAHVHIRAAVDHDQRVIQNLVRSERLNPNDLQWPNFLVACNGNSIVGTVQLRKHKDGARELGSLMVVPPLRGAGIAQQLIDVLLAGHSGVIHMITAARHAARYQHWGFTPVSPLQAPRSIRRNYCMGRLAGFVFALIKQRKTRRLVILVRRPDAQA